MILKWSCRGLPELQSLWGHRRQVQDGEHNTRVYISKSYTLFWQEEFFSLSFALSWAMLLWEKCLHQCKHNFRSNHVDNPSGIYHKFNSIFMRKCKLICHLSSHHFTKGSTWPLLYIPAMFFIIKLILKEAVLL